MNEALAEIERMLAFAESRVTELGKGGDPDTRQRFIGASNTLQRLVKHVRALDGVKYAGVNQLLRAYGLPTSDWTFGQGTVEVLDPETGSSIAWFDVIAETDNLGDVVSLRVKDTDQR